MLQGVDWLNWRQRDKKDKSLNHSKRSIQTNQQQSMQFVQSAFLKKWKWAGHCCLGKYDGYYSQGAKILLLLSESCGLSSKYFASFEQYPLPVRNEWLKTFWHPFAPIHANWPITVLRYVSSLRSKKCTYQLTKAFLLRSVGNKCTKVMFLMGECNQVRTAWWSHICVIIIGVQEPPPRHGTPGRRDGGGALSPYADEAYLFRSKWKCLKKRLVLLFEFLPCHHPYHRGCHL